MALFEAFPDEARLWVYPFERPLSDEDRRIVRDALAAFVEQWASHGSEVNGAYTVLHDRFVLLAGISKDGISGCSIDSSTGVFKTLRDRHGLNALNRGLVFFRDASGAIRALDRDAFQKEVDAGRCGADTVVFDATVQTVGALRAGGFELPLSRAWHAQAFLTGSQQKS